MPCFRRRKNEKSPSLSFPLLLQEAPKKQTLLFLFSLLFFFEPSSSLLRSPAMARSKPDDEYVMTSSETSLHSLRLPHERTKKKKAFDRPPRVTIDAPLLSLSLFHSRPCLSGSLLTRSRTKGTPARRRRERARPLSWNELCLCSPLLECSKQLPPSSEAAAAAEEKKTIAQASLVDLFRPLSTSTSLLSPFFSLSLSLS